MALLQPRRADHITLVVEQLDRAAMFYEQILGATPIPRPAFSFPGRWFDVGGFQIHMNVAGAEAGPGGWPGLGGNLVTRGLHLAFLVEDCQQAFERLQAQGVAVEVPPRNRPDGWWQLYLRDPDGHLLELCSPPRQ